MVKKDNKSVSNLKVLFVSSEFSGFAKTGGLGDVSCSLPLALKKAGVDVRVVIPFYNKFFSGKAKKIISSLTVYPGSVSLGFSVYETNFKGLTVYMIEHHHYFGRERLYDDGFEEYHDNPERFCLLSAGALKIADELNFVPDFVHCNDWQTALIPLYLNRLREHNFNFKHTKSLLTVHNGFFQGKFAAYYQDFLGLGESFHMYAYEEFGYINLLKGGIFYSDYVNTVSEGYSKELLSPQGSHGLYMTYRQKQEKFFGILNGCDYENWNPATDKLIAKNYTAKNLSGKIACRQDLLKIFNLDSTKPFPVIGIVSRMTAQKGFFYTVPALFELLKKDVFLVALGAGDQSLVNSFQYLRNTYPHKVGWYHGYNEELAHKIEAGSNFFLMPSLFEPCGLNQMYSHAYGTLPVVRKVGGLGDTVKNYDSKNFKHSDGFVFEIPSYDAVYNTLLWALDVYKKKPEHFLFMMKSAMSNNFSWELSARNYIEVYSK